MSLKAISKFLPILGAFLTCSGFIVTRGCNEHIIRWRNEGGPKVSYLIDVSSLDTLDDYDDPNYYWDGNQWKKTSRDTLKN